VAVVAGVTAVAIMMAAARVAVAVVDGRSIDFGLKA
jgi:hypothetical protein